MSVVAGVVKAAAGAKVLTEARLAKKGLPRIKRTLVVGAVALFVLAAFAALIPASETPNAENSSAASTNVQSVTEAPGSSEPQAGAPQMSKKEALDAYEKLPLSFVPNEGQTDKAVRYYAQGGRATASSSPIRGPRSPAPKAREVATRWPSTSLVQTPTLRSRQKSGFRARSTTW